MSGPSWVPTTIIMSGVSGHSWVSAAVYLWSVPAILKHSLPGNTTQTCSKFSWITWIQISWCPMVWCYTPITTMAHWSERFQWSTVCSQGNWGRTGKQPPGSAAQSSFNCTISRLSGCGLFRVHAWSLPELEPAWSLPWMLFLITQQLPQLPRLSPSCRLQ